jgi:hypothetical protein
MILDCGDVHASSSRAAMVHLANTMAARRWKLYQLTKDERHAVLAEWWHEQVSKALREAS